MESTLAPLVNLGVAALRKSAAILLAQDSAALCQDTATVQGFKARILRGILPPILIPNA